MNVQSELVALGRSQGGDRQGSNFVHQIVDVGELEVGLPQRWTARQGRQQGVGDVIRTRQRSSRLGFCLMTSLLLFGRLVRNLGGRSGGGGGRALGAPSSVVGHRRSGGSRSVRNWCESPSSATPQWSFSRLLAGGGRAALRRTRAHWTTRRPGRAARWAPMVSPGWTWRWT